MERLIFHRLTLKRIQLFANRRFVDLCWQKMCDVIAFRLFFRSILIFNALSCLIASTIVVDAEEQEENVDFTLFVLNTQMNKAYNLTCVNSGSSSSIIWIGDTGNHLKTYVTVKDYDDERTTATIDCDIDDDENCTSYWINSDWWTANSFDYDFGHVKDYRLENFPAYRMPEFVIDEKDIKVPLTMKGSSGEIKFKLGKKQLVYDIQVSLDNIVKIKGRNGVTGWTDQYQGMAFNQYLNDFQIGINSTTIAFGYYKNGFPYTQATSNTGYRFLSFQDENWIVHNYTFIYTNKSTVQQRLGPIVEVKDANYYYCVSMFVAMCKGCELKIVLFVDDYQRKSETFRNEDSGWKRIKFIVNERINGKVFFTFDTIATEENQFWAIDRIERCSMKDIRYTVLTDHVTEIEDTPCVLPQEKKMLQVVSSTQRLATKKCGPNQFGDRCMNCTLIFGDDSPMCNRRSECFNDNDHTTCNCRIGFYGRHCYNECKIGYGLNCGMECGFCYAHEKCHHASGRCPSGCKRGYEGDLCKLPTNYPVIINPPIIIDVNYTSVLVKVNDSDVHNPHLAWQYYFLYDSKDGDGSIASHRNYWSERTESTKILNLKPATNYWIKSVVTSEDGSRLDFLPNTTFRTRCRMYSENEINLSQTENSFNYYISYTTPLLCESEYCMGNIATMGNVYYNGSLFGSQHARLNFSTDYTFEIRCPDADDVLKLHFKTKPRKLDAVKNVIATGGTSYLYMKWSVPENTEGTIDYYIISCQLYAYKGCPEYSGPINNFTKFNAKFREYNITDLKPFSKYLVKIQAFNGLEGNPSARIYDTLSTETIEENELTGLKLDSQEPYKLNINVDPKNCRNIKGHLYCTAEAEFMNENRSLEKSQTICDNVLSDGCSIPSKPFTDYNISLTCARRNNDPEVTVIKSIRSLPAAPGPIQELEIYEVSYNIIRIRWKPAYPANGILKGYRFSYSNNRYLFRDQLKNCKLWKDFYCYTFSGLWRNSNYKIEAQAFNENVSEPSESVIVETVTWPQVPGQPSNVTCTLSHQSDKLIVNWKHPDKPISPILRYRITLPRDIKSQPIAVPYVEQIDYEHTVNVMELLKPKQIYVLDICAIGEYNLMSEKVNCTVTTPPLEPFLSGNIQVYMNSDKRPEISIPSCENFDGLLYILIQRYDDDVEEMTKRLNDCIVSNEFDGWIAAELQQCTSTTYYALGTGNPTISIRNKGLRIYNQELIDDRYTITVLLLNEFGNTARCSHESYEYKRQDVLPSSNDAPWIAVVVSLLILGLIVVIVFIIYRKRKNLTDWRSALTMKVLTEENNSTDEMPLTKKHNDRPPATVKPKLAVAAVVKLAEEHTKEVPLSQLENYVKESLQNGELDRQHKLFPRGQTKPWTYGMLPENKFKNRYNNLIAYDHTRVVLHKDNADPFSDYINANYIEGNDCPQAYIATQGPKPLTINDFWKMIWQENVKYIIMLTNITENGKKKCEKYWPEINTECDYGQMTVSFDSTIVYANFEQRFFTIKNGNSMRKLEHLHFLSWPDHGVPLYAQSLLPFLRKMLTIPQENSPIVVHCSAGVGRTGTIILSDICLRMAAREGKVDVLRYLDKLRSQRPNMVDNIEQYKLVHLLLLECLFAPETAIECDENIERKVEKVLANEIDNQLNYLKNSMWKDNAMETIMMNPDDEEDQRVTNCLEKNRVPDIVPGPHARLYLTRYPHDDESSSYINAVKVDGFRDLKKYIVTQQPLPNTVGDFWRLVHEHNVTVIVSLNEINPRRKDSCYFWPINNESEFNLVPPYMQLELSEFDEYRSYTIYTLHLYVSKNADQPEKIVVRLVQVKGWLNGKQLPKYPEQLLEILEVSDRYSCCNQPTIVTCFDGATASGLFVAASFVVDEIKMEQLCDVCLAVRTIRHSRRKFVEEKAQFRYLYEVALSYLKTFETYSNFITRSKDFNN